MEQSVMQWLEHAWVLLVGVILHLYKEVRILTHRFDTVVTKEEYKETLSEIKDVLKDAVHSINTLNINMAKFSTQMKVHNDKDSE